MRDLNGEEKLRLFDRVNLTELFPSIQKIEIIDQIWRDFFVIYNSVKLNIYSNITNGFNILRGTFIIFKYYTV